MSVIECVQINLHHSIVATNNLCANFAKKSRSGSYVAFLQEPYCRDGRVRGLHNRGTIIETSDSNGHPRAALLVSHDRKVWKLTKFCTRDIAAGILYLGGEQIVIASIYMPHDEIGLHPSPGFRNLIEHCELTQRKLVVAADANSHHNMWGCISNNRRGDVLVEYLATTSLQIVNTGHTPTFVTKSRSEILDVTMVTMNGIDLIQNWWVDVTDSFSDHRAIIFELKEKCDNESTEYRNKRKTNWITFKEGVQRDILSFSTAPIETNEDLDNRVEKLTEILINNFKDSCPSKKIKPNRKQVPWWSKTIAELRKVSKRMYRIALAVKTDEAWNDHCSARKDYKTAIRKSRRKSWRNFCSEINTMPEASRMFRLLKDDPFVKLGPLEQENGLWTESPEETLDLLLQTHFPENSTNHTDVNHEERSENGNADIEKIITPHTVKTAIESFSSFRAPGADEIFPAMLKETINYIKDALVLIYTSCLRLGYTPKLWKTSKVIFIPKPGKRSYTVPSSWRPISLTSFMLKALERMVDWSVKTEEMVCRLRSVNQFAYLRGASTEAALHNLVTQIEGALCAKEIALGLFLDIEGAFNKVPHKSIERALIRLKIPSNLIVWIMSMLVNRNVTSSISGTTCSRDAKAGCPQGGVLSPFLWDCVMDELLSELKENVASAKSLGFADDLTVVQRGICFETIRCIMQNAIGLISRWCKKVGLSVNPTKTEAIVFTNRNLKGLKPLKFDGIELPYREKVKYLGVILDSKLTWRSHCLERTQKLKLALFQCRRAVSKKWGMSPTLMKWIYVAIIRPALSYGAVVWSTSLRKKNCLTIVSSIQRLALLIITSALKTTPTAALECLANVQPIDIFMDTVAINTMHRLSRNGSWESKPLGGNLKRICHGDACNKAIKDIPILAFPCDMRRVNPLLESPVTYKIPSDKEWENRGEPLHTGEEIVIYTDGSRHDDKTGAAYTITYGGETWEEKIPLGTHSTVFQAEILAILHAASAVTDLNEEKRNVFIYTDSLSSISALNTWRNMTEIVQECFQVLYELGSKHNVTVSWIPAHKGFHGNEQADELAKEAADDLVYGPEPIVAVSQELIKTSVQKWAEEKHRKYWNSIRGCRQTKELIQLPNGAVSRFILNLSREKARWMINILTGHNYLQRHLFLMKQVDSPVCEQCGEEEETSFHFLARCAKYARDRYLHFEANVLTTDIVRSSSLSGLLFYIKSTGRLCLDLERGE